MYDLEDLVKVSEEREEKPEIVKNQCAVGQAPFSLQGKKRVHLLGLGDVGGTLLTGLKLLGGDSIAYIGICTGNQQTAQRYEVEMNQIAFPWAYDQLPEVKVISKEELFDCEVFVFCASKGVPAVGTTVADVRMVQFAENRKIVAEYAQLARQHAFRGLFAVVSDPVDPLCREAYLKSNENHSGIWDGKGLTTEQIRGYGLGVMNSRAAYFAQKDSRFASFLTEGRVFGPHGEGLVVANSIDHYDDELSKELTELTVCANQQVRALGFKPYIAPALSSGAISLLLTIKGEWHYSSTAVGGIFLGAKNRLTAQGTEVEKLPLPEKLFHRIECAYEGLKRIK